MIIKRYLEKNNISMYKIAKENNIAQTTIFNASNKKLDSLSFKILRAIAKSLNKTVGQVADELEQLDKEKDIK
ncbi:helix-turn-helix domain-containing protein [Pediococcus pentosaceus]|uniref:helix-turn-helix domain-containing protein n=1 Tax=Pediococcus pentosaceus TaxID=1255 RepID=UPI001F56E62A|nr:helix-turn-helix domain-containing protein [Pediococcus pentosaceus]MCI2961001.1 hypothetical protein [Pediococcus pentosaceus]